MSTADADSPQELSLAMDQHGRVVGASGPLQFGFRSFPTALPLAELSPSMLSDLLRDCGTTFTARSMDDDEQYSSGTHCEMMHDRSAVMCIRHM